MSKAECVMKQKIDLYSQEFIDVISGKPTAWDNLTHAVCQGLKAAEFKHSKAGDNPYTLRSIYRWCWYTGFDIGQRYEAARLAANEAAKFIPENMDIKSLDAGYVYALAGELAKHQVYGEWQYREKSDYWFRARAERAWIDDYVQVFHHTATGDGSWCSKTGWYWRIGVGVVSISSASNCRGEPYATREEAMRAVESVLRRDPKIILVGDVP